MNRALPVAVTVLLAAALLWMAAGSWRANRGDAVVLEAMATAAGDAVQLRYRIGELDLDEIAGQRNFVAGDPVYVTLRPGKPFWRAVSVCREYPVVPQGDVALRGEVIAVGNRRHGFDSTAERTVRAPVLTVRYGIENAIMAARTTGGPVAVELAVDPAGIACVDAVTAGGK